MHTSGSSYRVNLMHPPIDRSPSNDDGITYFLFSLSLSLSSPSPPSPTCFRSPFFFFIFFVCLFYLFLSSFIFSILFFIFRMLFQDHPPPPFHGRKRKKRAWNISKCSRIYTLYVSMNICMYVLTYIRIYYVRMCFFIDLSKLNIFDIPSPRKIQIRNGFRKDRKRLSFWIWIYR